MPTRPDAQLTLTMLNNPQTAAALPGHTLDLIRLGLHHLPAPEHVAVPAELLTRAAGALDPAHPDTPTTLAELHVAAAAALPPAIRPYPRHPYDQLAPSVRVVRYLNRHQELTPPYPTRDPNLIAAADADTPLYASDLRAALGEAGEIQYARALREREERDATLQALAHGLRNAAQQLTLDGPEHHEAALHALTALRGLLPHPVTPAGGQPEPQYCVSLNGELFSHTGATEAEAVEEALDTLCEIRPGRTLDVGRALPIGASSFLPSQYAADDLLERLREESHESGEYADEYLAYVTAEQEAVLQRMLEVTIDAWADRYGHQPKFYQVGDTREVTIGDLLARYPHLREGREILEEPA